MSLRSSTKTQSRGRPKGDPAIAETRNKLIREGLIHLTERGYSSVGVDEILKAAGVPKGSFYHYFQNKADFGSHLIDAYNVYFLARLEAAFENAALSPLQQLKSFIETSIEGMARHGFRRGCLIGNLGQEMGALPEEYRAKLIAVLADWQKTTAECLSRAQDFGELSPEQDPLALAEFFWIGWEGAVLRAKLERSAAPLSFFSDNFFAILNR